MTATKATAKLSNYRQAPRKVRLVADIVRGKTVPVALRELSVLPKRATMAFSKLIQSAAANAKESGMTGELLVKEIRVDQGTIMKRMRPRAHGRGFPIHKHTSHIMVSLVETGTGKTAIVESKDEPEVKKKAVAKKATTKKTTPKKSTSN